MKYTAVWKAQSQYSVGIEEYSHKLVAEQKNYSCTMTSLVLDSNKTKKSKGPKAIDEFFDYLEHI